MIKPDESFFPANDYCMIGNERVSYQTSGITKRECMALHICASICGGGEPEDVKHNAIVAVRQADALIEQLNMKETNSKVEALTV